MEPGAVRGPDLRGEFPEPLGLPARIRRFWFDASLDSVILRDIAEFAQVQPTRALPRILGQLAAPSGSGIVVADLARSLGLSPITTANSLGHLGTVFLTQSLPAWSTSIHASRSPDQGLRWVHWWSPSSCPVPVSALWRHRRLPWT